MILQNSVSFNAWRECTLFGVVARRDIQSYQSHIQIGKPCIALKGNQQDPAAIPDFKKHPSTRMI